MNPLTILAATVASHGRALAAPNSHPYGANCRSRGVEGRNGSRPPRVVCAVDCGITVNPDTIQAQIQSAIMFGITAALYGEITLKDGRVSCA